MKTKILLADDEEDLEDLFHQLFYNQIQSQTYEFFFARTGLEALALLEQQPDMDVLITDINMPGIDGLALLGKVPTLNPVLRTIILTAYGDMANIRTAMNRGAFDFLTKPINFLDLEATLTKAIRSANHYRETLELRAVDAMKTRFFANITHELRTPLSLIVVLIDKLLETLPLSPLYQQPLLAIQRNVSQLLRLINQLLDINKLEAHQMELDNEVGDLPSFVEQIVDLFRPSAEIKQLALIYTTDMPSGTYLFDADKWEKILYNLLSNAIKFTRTGRITVSLTQTPASVQLSVSDTGIGIPADKLPHIFNRFYQVGGPSVDSLRRRAYEGTGIGLALVHELTGRLGGRVWIESQLPANAEPPETRFVVEIPLPPASESAPVGPLLNPTISVEKLYTSIELPPPTDTAQLSHTPLVLVVEDNAELRAFMVAELVNTYRIRSAANGYEGWILAKEELPDLIISDLVMPRLDGYEFLEQLRTDPATDHIAVVLLTASVAEENRLKGLAYGADDYLTKPFNMNELRLRLRNLLVRQAKLREEYLRQFIQPHAKPTPETIQNRFLQQLNQLLEEHLADSLLNVDWLATHLVMSRKALYRKVHALTNLSPNELIRQYRLRRAIDLLRAGHNASETAYQVGFESPSYFTKVFKEYYQQTPSEYLKR